MNEVLKSKNNKSVINDKSVTLNGAHCTDKKEILHHFNNYFTNMSHCLMPQITN